MRCGNVALFFRFTSLSGSPETESESEWESELFVAVAYPQYPGHPAVYSRRLSSMCQVVNGGLLGSDGRAINF